MADDQQLSLEVERLRAEDLLHTAPGRDVPLAVAAAMTFHQAHRSTRAIVTRADYDDALNMAAAALSRLIPVYVLRDPKEGRKPLAFDLGTQRFSRGATELHGKDGSVVGDLTVRRTDLVPALSLIRRAGIPFAFAPAQEPPVQQGTKQESR